MADAPIKISIITSVKNGGAYFDAAMNSILKQSYEHWDYLIIDAGSTDGSAARAEVAAQQDPRIRFERRDGEPLYQSLMWGLGQTSGDYLAWLNADDLYTPWAFASLNQFIQAQHSTDWVTGLPACWDKDGAMRFVRANAWRPRSFIKKGMFHLNGLGFLQQESMFFSRALFERLTQSERDAVARQKFAGDFLLWKTFAQYAELDVAPAALGGFRQHGRNMSAEHMEDYMAEVAAIGAWMPPPRIGAMARWLYDLAAAIKTPALVRKAELALTKELAARNE